MKLHAHAIFGQIACTCNCACIFWGNAIVPIWVSFNSSGLKECCPRRWRPKIKNIHCFSFVFSNFLFIYKNGWPHFGIDPIFLKFHSVLNYELTKKFQLNIFGFCGPLCPLFNKTNWLGMKNLPCIEGENSFNLVLHTLD